MHSEERLRFYVEKRMQTIMIGALSKFEDQFGYLWGHDLDEEVPLTDEQNNFLDLWEHTRNLILNQGNNQIRHNKEDFDKWVGGLKQQYHYAFKPPVTEYPEGHPMAQSQNSCSKNCKCNRSN